MKLINKVSLILLFQYSALCIADIEYYYPFKTGPTSSNYGLTGLLETPNARMMPEGQLKFIFSSSFPNEFTAITASPFPWMEASYRYTEIKNKKYSGDPSFSGNQTWKDKGFDLKLRLLDESYYTPSLAVGFNA